MAVSFPLRAETDRLEPLRKDGAIAEFALVGDEKKPRSGGGIVGRVHEDSRQISPASQSRQASFPAKVEVLTTTPLPPFHPICGSSFRDSHANIEVDGPLRETGWESPIAAFGRTKS